MPYRLAIPLFIWRVRYAQPPGSNMHRVMMAVIVKSTYAKSYFSGPSLSSTIPEDPVTVQCSVDKISHTLPIVLKVCFTALKHALFPCRKPSLVYTFTTRIYDAIAHADIG